MIDKMIHACHIDKGMCDQLVSMHMYLHCMGRLDNVPLFQYSLVRSSQFHIGRYNLEDLLGSAGMSHCCDKVLAYKQQHHIHLCLANFLHLREEGDFNQGQ